MKRTAKRVLAVLLAFVTLVANCITSDMTVSAAVTKPAKITLNYTSKKMSAGETITLSVKTVKPAKASKSVTWKSSNTKIATVTSKGKVKAKKAGNVTITAKSKKNSKVVAKCKIKVYTAAKKITLNYKNKTIYVGNSTTLKVKSVTPAKALKNVTWKSSNTKVATVSSTGKVKAKKAGTVTITARDKGNTKVKATCKITVKTKKTTPAASKPDNTKPGNTTPDNTKPDNTKPDDTKPDDTTPDNTKPDDTKPDDTKPDDTTSDEQNNTYYNRAEWIAVLADKMGYSIVEDNLNKDLETGEIIYSFDDIYDNENVLKIEAAMQNGIIPIDSDSETESYLFQPTDPVTREFAAVTVARALGLSSPNTTIECNDSAELKYPLEVQAAIEAGMFHLSDDAFCPNKLVTDDEFTNILQIADEILGSWEVDPNHENIIEYTENVVEDTTQMTDYSVSAADEKLYVTLPINEATTTLKAGQIVLLPANDEFTDGLPIKIDSVLNGEENIIIEGQLPESANEVYEHVDLEGIGQIDVNNIVLADGVTLVEEEPVFLYRASRTTVTEEFPLSMKKTFNAKLYESESEVDANASASVSLYLDSVQYKFDFDEKGVNEVLVKVPNTITASVDATAAWEGKKEIGTIPIKLPAGFSLELVLSVVAEIDGSIHVEYCLDNTFGVHYTKNNGLQKITKMEKSWEIELDANTKTSVELDAEFTWLSGIRNGIAELFGKESIAAPLYTLETEAGLGINANTTVRNSGLVCTNASVYLYWDISVGEDCMLSAIAPALEYKWEIFNEENSPLKATCHWENSKRVAACTYGTNEFQIQVLDTSGRPLSAKVTFHSAGGTVVYTTDANGLLKGTLTPGIYSCIVTKSGYKTYSGGITIKNVGLTSMDIKLALSESDTTSNGEENYDENVPDKGGDDDVGTDTGEEENPDKDNTEEENPDKDNTEEENIPILYSGTWRGMDWKIDKNNTLTISGEYTYAGTIVEAPAWVHYYVKNAVVTAKNVKSTYSWFFGCGDLTSLDLSSFDTGNVTDMGRMFYGCCSLTSLDLSSFDTSKVTDMSWMFYGCSSLESLDLSSFNTSKVTDMSWMFDSCISLESLDLSSFDTSNVTDMGDMFDGCSGLTSLDLSSFDTSNVTDMGDMFDGCRGLTSLNLSSFNTSNVTDMGQMFGGCRGLTSLDLSSFNTSKVTNMGLMFYGCSSLTQMNIPLNVMVSVNLPNGSWKDAQGNTYTTLPTEVTQSFLITKSAN